MTNPAGIISVELVDGTKVLVPDSLELITPYVLQEQGDWFEDEIKFLRQLVQPGNTVVDIGANYGVYALSLSRKVGPSGNVWAFEPASETAQLLRESSAANGTTWLQVVQQALSDQEGTAWLQMPGQAELNSLADPAAMETEADQGPGESVAITTLDHCLELHGWMEVDLLKIDAEGEEERILKGGKRFFSELSPLVMYKVKAGTKVNLDYIKEFEEIGYRSFRLVPGLNCLAPFSANQEADGYHLNLFAAKPDRIRELTASGWIVDDSETFTPTDEELLQDGWLVALEKLPYAQPLARNWQIDTSAEDQSKLRKALKAWSLSQEVDTSCIQRYRALAWSYNHLKIITKTNSPIERWASLARVAMALGERTQAVRALNILITKLKSAYKIGTHEPFLSPGENFESVQPTGPIEIWLEAACLTTLEYASTFSGFYSAKEAKARLTRLNSLGYFNETLQRRSHLITKRLRNLGIEPHAKPPSEEAALEAIKMGQHRTALRIYSDLLQNSTDNTELIHLQIGMVYGLLSDTKNQDKHILLAHNINPANPRAILNYGTYLFRHEQISEAREHFEEATRHIEVQSLAYGNLAAIALNEGNRDEASRHLSRSLAIDPNNNHSLELAFKTSATALKDKESIDLFIQQFTKANPALILLIAGKHCRMSGMISLSINYIESALRLDLDNIAAQLEKASILSSQGRSDEAIEQLLYALTLQPDNIDLLLGMGYCSQQIGQVDSAIYFYEKILEIEVIHPQVSNLLGCAVRLTGRDQEAIPIFVEALRHHPNDTKIKANLASTLRNVGRMNESVELARKILIQDPASEVGFFSAMFTFSTLGRDHAVEMLGIAKSFWASYRENLISHDHEWKHIAANQERPISKRNEDPAVQTNTKLKIAFLSAEIGEHVVGMFMRSFLANYNHSIFHVTLITSLRRYEQTEQELIDLADASMSLQGLNRIEASKSIQQHDFDVILDTSGYTNNSQISLLAFKLAKVQCHYIGYHASTGLDSIDYFIADNVITPPQSEDLFSEKVIRLSSPWITISYHKDPPLASSTAQVANFTFGSFNQSAKFNQKTFGYWASALRAVPDSFLVIKDRSLVSESRRDWISNSLQELGVSIDRICFIGGTASWTEHMDTYNIVDACLDCTNWSGSTTVFDALSMGTPYVAIKGDTMSSRMSSSILTGLGHAAWIANTEHEFGSIAAMLANELNDTRNGKQRRQVQFLNKNREMARSRTRQLEKALLLACTSGE